MTELPRILVVEDEAITALDLELTLSALGYEVGRVVATGAEAVAEAVGGTYALVLTDIVLRGPMDGVDAASEIVARTGLPVVFLTAYGDSATLTRAKAARPYGYLIKPFHAEALRATVETALMRADLEHRLVEREAELAALSVQLLRAREDERGHLAREIHDDLGQALTLLRLQASWIRDHAAMPAAELVERHLDMARVIDGASGALRRIVSGLRPPILDEARLSDALRWQCDTFAAKTGVSVDFDSDEPPGAYRGVSDEASTALFRLLQEALTNVARHASAHRVAVRLRVDAHGLTLAVQDDGVGLRATPSTGRAAFGSRAVGSA